MFSKLFRKRYSSTLTLPEKIYFVDVRFEKKIMNKYWKIKFDIELTNVKEIIPENMLVLTNFCFGHNYFNSWHLNVLRTQQERCHNF